MSISFVSTIVNAVSRERDSLVTAFDYYMIVVVKDRLEERNQIAKATMLSTQTEMLFTDNFG